MEQTPCFASFGLVFQLFGGSQNLFPINGHPGLQLFVSGVDPFKLRLGQIHGRKLLILNLLCRF